jgi:hypothetical protein
MVVGESQSQSRPGCPADDGGLWYFWGDLDDRWNMDRVTLTLAVARSRSPLEEKYYVVGDIAELGGWNEKKLMKRVRRGGMGAGVVRGGKERDATVSPPASSAP